MSICKNINKLSNKELVLVALKLLQQRMQKVSDVHVKSFAVIVRSLCRETR